MVILLKWSILNSKMTYQQNKENKEHVGHKVDWPKNSVSTVNGIIIKVSKNNPELCGTAGRKKEKNWLAEGQSSYLNHSYCSQDLLHAFCKGTEGLNHCPKEQISKLSVSKEDNEEHDGESQNVFSTSTQCGGQLHHGLIKTDVLENLQGQENTRYWGWYKDFLSNMLEW